MIFVCLSFIMYSSLGVAQTAEFNVGSHSYRKVNGEWYVVAGQRIEEKIDARHIVVHTRTPMAEIPNRILTADGSVLLKDKYKKMAGDYHVFEIPSTLDPFKVIGDLSKASEFDDVMFNLLAKLESVPNDPSYSSQWNLSRINAPSAWGVTTGATSVIVGVIDVGGDYNHPDLQANLWSGIGYDFISDDSDPYPYDGARHGTAVAGIIAAVTNNGTGIAGVAGGWGSGGIKLMHLRSGYVYQGLETLDLAASAAAVTFAADNGASVINMSFGVGYEFPALQAAIDEAINNHAVIPVAASGNYYDPNPNSKTVRYPAKWSNVIAVGALTETDMRKAWNDSTDENYWGSCYGPELDIVAPGIHIPTTDIQGTPGYTNGDYFASFAGTSSSAPTVAGVVALIRSLNPLLSNTQVRSALLNTATKVPAMGGSNFTNEYGYGRLDAYAAVKYALSNHGGNLTQDVTIPTGDTWTLTSGTTWTFAPYNKLRVQGVLSAGGVTFTSTGGQWYGIEFYNGQYGSTIGYSTIQNAQFGAFIYNTYVQFTNCRIQYNSTGIYASCSSTAVRYSQLENNTIGVECASYGCPDLTPSNRFRSMDISVRCDGTSQPYLGSYIGYNSFYWNGWDVFSNYPGSIWAWGNWWGSYPADPWVYGTVDWSNPLQLDPNPQKAAVREHPLITPPTTSGSVKDTAGLACYEGLRLRVLANANATLTIDLQSLIDQFPDKLSGRMAVILLTQLRENQGNDLNSFLANLVSRYGGTAVARIAEQLQIGAMVKAGDPKGAFSLARSLVQAGDTLSLKQAIYDAGSLAWYYLNDKPTGATYFTRLANDYPDDPLANSALAAMGQASAKSAKQSQTPIERPVSFDLETNYPNPFNPSTRINYTVAEPGYVSLIIYDVLGREIATLAKEVQQAGHYSLTWDSKSSGIPISSGMYFALLRVTNELGGVKFAKTIKLLLTK